MLLHLHRPMTTVATLFNKKLRNFQPEPLVNLTNASAFVLRESGKLLVKPYIEELPQLFVSYFKEILRVGYELPRLEYYMSQGNIQLSSPLSFIIISKLFSIKANTNLQKLLMFHQCVVYCGISSFCLIEKFLN